MENNGIGISQTPCRSQQNFFTNYVLVPKMQGSLPLAHLVALESHYTKETSPKKKKKKKERNSSHCIRETKKQRN